MRALGLWDDILAKVNDGSETRRTNRAGWVQTRFGDAGNELIYDVRGPTLSAAGAHFCSSIHLARARKVWGYTGEKAKSAIYRMNDNCRCVELSSSMCSSRILTQTLYTAI